MAPEAISQSPERSQKVGDSFTGLGIRTPGMRARRSGGPHERFQAGYATLTASILLS